MKPTTFHRATLAPGLALGLALAPALLPAAALAQASATAEATELRLRRIESELRAVQRKVFPDGAGRTFAPEIAPVGPAPAAPQGGSSAISDLLARMDAVEAQLRTLTAQGEDSQHRLGKLEARVTALEPPPVVEPAAGAEPPAVAAPVPAPAIPPAPAPRPAAAKPAAKPAATAPVPAASEPPADRVAAVRAIERPSSDDKGEDEYAYGYRLWEAKFFPEAAQQLSHFVQTYPKHKRISYARNLLGRAYLDDNKPGMAAQVFVQNYQADKQGDRAPDSLLYLGVAMVKLKETRRACAALAELREVYPQIVAGRLKAQTDAAARQVTCD